MAESQQKKLDRVRAPKVQIKYEVENYGGSERRELPFVMGVVADLSGDNDVTGPDGKKLKLKDRKFTSIDPDNFNEVLKGAKPKVKCSVADKLTGNSDQNLNVDIQFESLDDFHPEKIAEKIEPLRKLLEARRKLASLKQKMDGNDNLEDKLNEILQNAESRNKLSDILNQSDISR
jgi:type VI secretion system protein ImpB